MALLQSQQTRFHQDVKFRPSNPTFASTNVGSSLGMNVSLIYRYAHINQPNQIQPEKPSSSSSKHSQLRNSSYEEANPITSRRNSNSFLSSYGTNSLKALNKYISDKEIYQKQSKKFNIITSLPKEFQDKIKIFPKYRLENQDNNYYKKMKIQEEITTNYLLKKTQKQQDQFQSAKKNSNPEEPTPSKKIRGNK